MNEELYAVYQRQNNQLRLLGDDLTLPELKPYVLKKAQEWNLTVTPVEVASEEGDDCILIVKHELIVPEEEPIQDTRPRNKPAPLHDYSAEYSKFYDPDWREKNHRALENERSGVHIPFQRIEQARQQAAQQMPSGYDRNQQAPNFMNFDRRQERLFAAGGRVVTKAQARGYLFGR